MKKMRTLFYGICFLSLEWMVNGAYLPEKTKKCIDKLNDHYMTKDDDTLYDGHPIFQKKLEFLAKSTEKNEQKLLMTIILDAYNRIFTQMENKTQDESVRRELRNVKDQLNKLKVHYFSDTNNLKKYASEVLALKESDPLVQRKALFELETVYSAATELVQNHRRRRQARGPKKQRPRS